MTGHLEKRNKNSWRIVIEIGRDPQTGKRKRISRSVKGNKKQAEKVMHRLLHELEQGTYIEPSEFTLGDYLRRWLEDYCRINLAPSTFASYEIIVIKHLVPALGNIPLAKLQPMHLQQYYSRALKEGRRDGKGGLSSRTVRYHHTVLREALQHAVKWQVVVRNVADAVEPPRVRQPEMAALNPNDVMILLKAVQNHQDYAIIFTAIYTGMRRGELLGLRWNDVDLDAGVARIRQTLQKLQGQGFIFREPKTKKSRRQITLSVGVVNLLKELRKKQAQNRLLLGNRYQNNDLVFCNNDGTPIDPSKFSKRFRYLADKHGFTNIRFHDLRHTHATILLTQGVHPKVVQERLGHESITITMDTYSHILPGLQEEAMKKFDEAMQSSEKFKTEL